MIYEVWVIVNFEMMKSLAKAKIRVLCFVHEEPVRTNGARSSALRLLTNPVRVPDLQNSLRIIAN